MKKKKYFDFVTDGLWAHQKKACAIAEHRDNYALFFEMGIGKTATAITILRIWQQQEKKFKRTLVLCPKIIISQWGEEINKFSKMGRRVCLLEGTSEKRLKTLKKNIDLKTIFVTNHETLSMEKIMSFLDGKIEVLILDESHKFKNATAKRTVILTKFSKNIKKKICLTGTPVLNNTLDLFSQFQILDGGKTFGNEYYVFRSRYFSDHNEWMKNYIPTAGSNKKVTYFPKFTPKESSYGFIKKAINENALVKSKKECLDLPPLIKKTIHCELSGKQRKVYKEVSDLLISEVDSKVITAANALVKVLRLQQIVSGYAPLDDDDQKRTDYYFKENSRLDALEKLLKEEIPQEAKVIIWARFKCNYIQIEELCKKLKISYSFIKGSQSDKERKKSLQQFKTDGKILIANQMSGGVGINLTEASYSVYFSQGYSLGERLQSEARNYRGGSNIHKTVTMIDLVAPDTVDIKILESLRKKKNFAEFIVSNKTLENIF